MKRTDVDAAGHGCCWACVVAGIYCASVCREGCVVMSGVPFVCEAVGASTALCRSDFF